MNSKAISFLIAVLLVVHSVVLGQGPGSLPVEPRGLRLKCDGASPGFTLFAPMSSDTTYLIDLDGQVVRTWKSDMDPSAWVYLLDNGHVLRGGSDPGTSVFRGGGQGGRFQEFDFDGQLVWDFKFNENFLPHHDVAVLPNGNVLAIVWESRTADEARRAGRRNGFIHKDGIWPDMLIEIEPQRPNGARIVWEWHMWDHLIQNVDAVLDNYGDLSQHPERIDLNGDTAGVLVPPRNPARDVFHTNAVAYNPALDQILLSVPTFNEVWVIDHSTTTQEAAGRTGGRTGKGGDLLYRWGNAEAYGRGAPHDRLLGFQHDARWIPPGRPGAGHVMVFNNRAPSPNSTDTKVYEFIPPVDDQGRYFLPANGPFGPTGPMWTYSKPDSFQASHVSGAERLENGNTLISSGPQGRLFEVTSAGEIVWEYWSPYSDALAGSNSASAFSLFRAIKIAPDHPALRGRDLSPLDPQPPVSPLAVAVPPTGKGTRSEDCPSIPAEPRAPFPDLSIRSSHEGNFGAGFEETYTVTVTNEGANVTAGPIVVRDTLPTGLTFVSATGPGWSCSEFGGAVTCTNSAALAANDSTGYTLIVAVDSSAASSVNHAVSVTVDGDLNAANNSATDVTIVVSPVPTFVLTPSPLVAGQQANVAVTMATAFPHDLTGSIALSFGSNAAIPLDDPAIQFATGGREVAFTIPADTLDARFGANPQAGSLGFQPGTVAGTLTFSGTLQVGSVQTTFSTAQTIPRQAPAIQTVRTDTEKGFAAVITLLSTTREVSALSLRFDTTPTVRLSCGTVAGCTVSGSTLTFDVKPLFDAWFAGDAAPGGLGAMRLPFSIQGKVQGSVGVSLRSSMGTSNSMSFPLP